MKPFTGLIAGASVFALAATLGMSATSAATTSPARAGKIIIDFDNHQAGYAANPLKGHATGFKYITASWTVPSVDCSLVAYSDDQLVTLGFEQVGIFSYCPAVGDAAVYEGGYVGAGGNQVNFAAHPGDAVTASVFYTASTKQYLVKVSDVNTASSFSTTVKCSSGCGNTWAGVAMSLDNEFGNDILGGFGVARFDTIKITDSAGQAGALLNPNWQTVESTENEDEGGQAPGPIYSATSPAESAFSIGQNS